MTRDSFSCFLGFQNFSGEDPRPPPPPPPPSPSRLENVIYFFNPTLLSKVFNSGLNIKSNFRLICVQMAIYLLPKDFLYPYHAIVYQSRDLKIRIR